MRLPNLLSAALTVSLSDALGCSVDHCECQSVTCLGIDFRVLGEDAFTVPPAGIGRSRPAHRSTYDHSSGEKTRSSSYISSLLDCWGDPIPRRRLRSQRCKSVG